MKIQKNWQTTRAKTQIDHASIKVLSKAIDAIPLGNDRKKLSMAVQLVLVAVSEATAALSFCTGQTVKADWEALGFTPLDDPNIALPWQDDVWNAYYTAVQSNPPWTDIFMHLHAECFDRQAHSLGQHFTPADLAHLVGRLAGSHIDRHPIVDETLALHDPCCGAGGLLLGHLAHAVDGKRYAVTATDLDPLCCAMTALQVLANTLLHGRKLVSSIAISCGNCLLDGGPVVFHYGPDEQIQAFNTILHNCTRKPAANDG
ncbi:TPA: N-6 DNA methylase [Stenotrophomonas maltophilia]